MKLLGKKEVMVLGMKHKISYFKEHDPTDSAMGRSLIKMGEIKICNEMPKDIQEQTISHEVVHIINDHLGIELKENQVCALASGLYSFIKENKL